MRMSLFEDKGGGLLVLAQATPGATIVAFLDAMVAVISKWVNSAGVFGQLYSYNIFAV